MSSTETPLQELVRLLDIEQIEENLFRGFHPPGRKHRLFGGQIIAQALMAAARTVTTDRPVHSLHAYFLRPGDPGTPAIFDVERIRDGRSFTTRRIVVIQRGEAIFNMDASFQVREEGLQHAFDMPDLRPPTESEIPDAIRGGPFLSFQVDHKRLTSESPQPPLRNIWFRANGPVPDDPLMHRALLAYESDSALLSTARLPHRGSYQRDRMQMASLDHSIWFHEPFDVGDWLLYSMDSPAAANSRGYNRGTIYSADGRLVASCMQEGLMRIWT
ncbi:MAG: acyl-CoA thioesterase [Pseudomonadota bacterium]